MMKRAKQAAIALLVALFALSPLYGAAAEIIKPAGISGSAAGIDYSAEDIIIKGTVGGKLSAMYYINLTKETLTVPAPFASAAYSVDGGNKWKNRPLDSRTLAKLFSKGFTLALTDRYDRKTRRPAEGAVVVDFPKINKRSKLERYTVNYQISADLTGTTPGRWVLTKKNGGTPVKTGLEIAVAKGRAPDENGFGRFSGEGANPDGVAVAPLPENGRPVKIDYLIRNSARNNGDGTYTAASKDTRITVKGQQKPKRYRANKKRGEIQHDANTYVVMDGGAQLKESKGGLDISGYDGDVFLWGAATANTPAAAVMQLSVETNGAGLMSISAQAAEGGVVPIMPALIEPASGVVVFWNAMSPDPLTVANGNTVIIEPGASGTLNVPAGANVSITGSSSPVDNTGSIIVLNIGGSATVTWEAHYRTALANGSAVTLTGSGTFIVSGGSIIETGATNDATLYAAGTSIITVTDGTITAVGGPAIHQVAANSKININSKLISSEAQAAILTTASGSEVNVSGGMVQGGISLGDSSTVNVSGGVVMAQGSNPAIHLGSDSFIDFSGGVVIAGGNTLGAVIGDYTPSGTGMIIAYETGTFAEGATAGIVKFPLGAAASWTNIPSPGIRYKNGTNEGHIPIGGVTVNPIIHFSAHPALNTTVTAGSISGALSVSASVEGSPLSPLSYQWYSNTTNNNSGGTSIFDATGASFTIPPGLPVGTYYYYCEVSSTISGVDPVNSNVATVTVNAVAGPSLSFGNQTLPPGTVGMAYSANVTPATGGTGPYTYSAIGLPGGLAMNSSGVFSGTPTAAITAQFSVTVTDSTSATATATFTITINATPITEKTVTVGAQIGTLTPGTAGTVTFPVTTANIANGTYTVTVANLPAGMSVLGQVTVSSNSGTLTLAGNTSIVAGTTNTLTLTIDGATSPAFMLTVGTAKSVLVGAQAGTLRAGTAGTVTFPVTTANIANGTYTVTVANLPAGMSVSGQVTVSSSSGTLTLAGNTSTVAGITNTLTLTIDGAASPAFTLTVTAAKTVTVGAQAGTLNAGTAGTVTFPVTTANIANGAYTVTVANLPAGMSVSGQVTVSSNSGTLTLAGNTSIVAGITSTLTLTIDGATSPAFTLTVTAAKTVTVGAQAGTLRAGTAGTVTFPVTTANIANGAYAVTVANLPAGMSVSGQVTVSSNSGTLTLAGNTSTVAGTTNTLTLTIDGAISPAFTLTVTAAKTVTVGAQVGTINAGTAGTVTFPVTTASIANGAYTVTVANLPAGMSVSGQVTVSNNSGTLTLAGNTSTVAGTTNTLTLTIDGAISPAFTLTVTAAPTYAVIFNVTGGNGTLTATVDNAVIKSNDTIAQGKNVVFTATPNSGYRVKQWLDNGVTVNGTNTTYTMSNITSVRAVAVEFEQIQATPGPSPAPTPAPPPTPGPTPGPAPGPGPNPGPAPSPGDELSQTGALVWPIPLLAVFGTFMIVLGQSVKYKK